MGKRLIGFIVPAWLFLAMLFIILTLTGAIG